MTRPISPYHKPGFYAEALSKGRHRDIVGGRWDETGRAQIDLLCAHGLLPHHRLLDIGAGSLRLGCKVVPYLDPGHYWATDKSGALMRAGHQTELTDPSRLSQGHLVEDPDFSFPTIPPDIDYAIAFAVFTHLPLSHLSHALTRIHAQFPNLQKLLFTAFLASDQTHSTALRQPDGVVTHPDRAPYHHLPAQILTLTHAAGFTAAPTQTRLPRGQILFTATRT